jgi:hypothetical protein
LANLYGHAAYVAYKLHRYKLPGEFSLTPTRKPPASVTLDRLVRIAGRLGCRIAIKVSKAA